jgi:hypothetical protein
MFYYEIYAGGVISGELVVETPKSPDRNGNVLLSQREYDSALSSVGRNCRGNSNYYEGYDVTTLGNRVVLHALPFDHPSIQKLLGDNHE